MDIANFALFFAAALAIAISPGPGLLYVTARTLAGGRNEGLASSFGTGLGGLVHVAAGAISVSALVLASAEAYAVLKIAGALYLVCLGYKSFRESAIAIDAKVTATGAMRAFREGIVVEALNPKTAAFFLAFLPQFVAPAEPLVPQLVLLGSVCVALNTLVDVIAVFATDRLLRSGAARAARARLMTRASGVTMLGLAAYLALARREG